MRSDGKPCTQRSINGLDEPLCATHAHPKKGGRRPKHGFYSETNLDQLEYLRRVRPEDWVQGGGLAPAEERTLQIREREMDLHPPDPALADIDVAIAALLHKMEILDALIFRAKCQFSPDMGPSVFGQSGPLPGMALVKLQVDNGLTIDARQRHGVDSMDTSFTGSFRSRPRKLVPVMTIMWAR